MSQTREPKIVSHQKMQDLAVLPIFYKLKNRKIIVAGHEVGALWKTELLAATGANIDLFIGQAINDEHLRVFCDIKNVNLITRAWQESDFSDAALAVCQSISEDDAQNFVNAAKKYGVPVNIIDEPKYCDFQFGAIVNRSPLVIGISTDGASPALAQQLRGKFEIMFPLNIANWLKKAIEWRPKIKALGLEFGQKRDFWHKFAKQALDDANQSPNDDMLEQLLAQTPKQEGQVILVGAGPGDPELLTVGAMRAMQMADVILFDDLVSQEVLDFARREAQLIAVGKRGRKPSTAQSTIIELMLQHANEGKCVVRIKGGDVLVFGRATEEIEACKNANIPIKIVAGISAAQGICAHLGISMTDRVHAQRVQFITGAGKRGGLPPEINFNAVADKDVSTFLYMPRGTIKDFVANAIKAGLSPDMPAAIIIDGTRVGQKNIFTQVSQLPDVFASFESDKPEIVIIGNILKNSKEYKL